MNATITKDEIKAALTLMIEIIKAVKEAGPMGLPEGPMYAVLVDRLSIDGWESMVRQILATKLVKRENHCLVWIG